MNPIEWVKSNVEKAGLIAAVVFLLLSAGALGYKLIGAHATIAAGVKQFNALHAEHETTVSNLAQCRSSNASLNASLSAQNAAVEALRAAAVERERKTAEAVQRARAEADGYRKTAGQIAAAQPVGDRCVAAADLIRSTLGAER